MPDDIALAAAARTVREGMIHCEDGRYAEALAAFERAALLHPADANAQYGRGRAQIALQHYGEALAAYDRALELNPGDADAQRARRGVIRRLSARRRT